MKKILPILFLFCLNPLMGQTESFEGIITYNVDIKIKNNVSEKYANFFTQKFGDTMYAYHSKNGDIKRVYINTGKLGNDFQLFIAKSNRYFSKDKPLDTIYFYNTSKNSMKLLNQEMNKDVGVEILNQQCSSLYYEGSFGKKEDSTKITYFYGTYPYIDPKLYENWSDFFTNDFISQSQSPYLKYILESQYFILTFTAIDIEKTELEPSVFELPKNVPLKGDTSF